MDIILRAEKIKKTYGKGEQEQQVLNSVSLNVRKGEFIAVMGPSGSGKSTLLYNISGMDRADAGSVRFADSDLFSMTEEKLAAIRLDKMGFVFQQPNLLKNLSIFDNIIFSAYMSKKKSRKDINKQGEKLMELTGISEIRKKDITEVSGGQLQRAAICRALMNDPEIVFGDEPTGALNSKATNEVMDIMKKINEKGTTVFLVTHDPKVAAEAERVIFMNDGIVAGEKKLGKIKTEDDVRKREKVLSGWLEKMEF